MDLNLIAVEIGMNRLSLFWGQVKLFVGGTKVSLRCQKVSFVE